MQHDRHRFRVYFGDGVPSRDVTARDMTGAKRTALFAERVTLNPRRRLFIVSIEDLGPVGYQAQPSLFQR